MADRQRVLQCQGEGYRAYLRRESPRANPYPYSTEDDCRAWIAGYARARTDRAIANRAVTVSAPRQAP
jgi:ribosome modulation factor